jgi:hypothetical protein
MILTLMCGFFNPKTIQFLEIKVEEFKEVYKLPTKDIDGLSNRPN